MNQKLNVPAKKEVAKETLLPAKETTAPITDAEAFEMMEHASAKDLVNLNGAEYLKMEEGEVKVFKFTAMTTFNSDTQGTIPAVTLVDKEGTQYVCPTTVVVQSLEKVTELPTFVRLTYKGKKQAKKGPNTYDDYLVEVFASATA